MIHTELPNASWDVIADELCVLLTGSLLQLLQKLLLLRRVLSWLACFVPFEDLVKGNLSRLVQPISQIRLLGTI